MSRESFESETNSWHWITSGGPEAVYGSLMIGAPLIQGSLGIKSGGRAAVPQTEALTDLSSSFAGLVRSLGAYDARSLSIS